MSLHNSILAKSCSRLQSTLVLTNARTATVMKLTTTMKFTIGLRALKTKSLNRNIGIVYCGIRWKLF